MTRFWLLAIALVRAAGADRVHRDLEFRRAGDVRLLLDLYLPESVKGPAPVIISIHGGGWHGGSKERSPGLDFTRFGYAVASINYRLTGQAAFPAQIHDCKAGVRWLRANARQYSLDPARFAAWGASAGGHLAALLGTSAGVAALEGDLGNLGESSRVQAVVDFFGPIDVAGWYRYKKDAFAALIGAPLAGNEERLMATDPRTYIDARDAPALIAHGAADTLVPVEHSRMLHEGLRRAGVFSDLRVIPEAGHSVTALNLEAEVRAFFDRHLRRE